MCCFIFKPDYSAHYQFGDNQCMPMKKAYWYLWMVKTYKIDVGVTNMIETIQRWDEHDFHASVNDAGDINIVQVAMWL